MTPTRREELVSGLMQRMANGEEVDKLTWPMERLWALRDERLRSLIEFARAFALARGAPGRRRPRGVWRRHARGRPGNDEVGPDGNWDANSSDRLLTLDIGRRALETVPENESQSCWTTIS